MDLAEADLWREADAAIIEAVLLAQADAGVTSADATILEWDRILIDIIGSRRLTHIARSDYPLLAAVFAGEHSDAVDTIRRFAPAEVFSRSGPLLAGTVAAGFPGILASYLIDYAGRAVLAQPDLAPAYFLRALGTYLLDGTTNSQTRADARRALALAPVDSLYRAVVEFLEDSASRP